MVLTISRNLLLTIVFGLFMTSTSHAADQMLSVGGMNVYYGIMPAEIVKKRMEKDGDDLHKGRLRKNSRHLVVALFDAANGERVSDATLTAIVTPLGLAPTEKKLETMHVDETITHGNFFEFPSDSAPFHVALKIGRKNTPIQTVEFDYRP